MNVVGVTGHQNIPDRALEFVKVGINNILTQHKGNFSGVTSLAAGADQIFAEYVIRLEGLLYVVIPCDGYEGTFSCKENLDLYLQLIEQAHVVHQLNFPEPSEDAFLQAGRYVVDHSDKMIAVWDGLKAVSKGGTADIVDYARVNNVHVDVVWPSGVKR